MALGDTYNNNEKKNYSPSVTSGYRFSNPESNVDQTCLTFSFWNKLLKISIAPKKKTEGDVVAFDYDNAGTVYLTHTKALIMHKEVMKFIKEFAEGTSVSNAGVSTGSQGLLYICDGKEFGSENPCLVIRKINEQGQSESCYAYEFRGNVHNSVINYNPKDAKFETNDYKLLELEQFAILLKEYYESMTMAVAYSIQESNKYDQSRLNTKLKVIGEKLGVDFKQQKSSGSRTVNTSYFNNAKSSGDSTYNAPTASYENGTLDDLD